MRWLTLPLLLLFAWQVEAQTPPNTKAMCPLAAALTKVARAVDVYAANEPNAATMRGDELVVIATQHDPDLLSPFSGLSVTARVEGRNSSVLVCSRNRQASLIEDAGCSAQSDAHLWFADLPCGFTLDLAMVCAGKARPQVNLCN